MEKSKLFDYDRLVKFRKDIHKHPETAYTEFRTGEKIYEYLESIGIKQSQIKKVAKTGYIVDINGTGPESGKSFCIALRTDLDALPIKVLHSNLAQNLGRNPQY
jgi:metal-dependent amidase/aminoacylase/carboxypeptidase family protein